MLARARSTPREFGATEIVTERGDKTVPRIKELTNDVGAAGVRRPEGSLMQAIRARGPHGSVDYVGVPRGIELDGEGMFFAEDRQWLRG